MVMFVRITKTTATQTTMIGLPRRQIQSDTGKSKENITTAIELLKGSLISAK